MSDFQGFCILAAIAGYGVYRNTKRRWAEASDATKAVVKGEAKKLAGGLLMKMLKSRM